jgi:uncharacterized protein YndB with AHSA1/START domain
MNQVDSDTEIITTRVFNAPRTLVFKAWTDPKHVAKWWGPKAFTSYDCEIDLRPGGSFRLLMSGPDGTVYPCRGIYREIVEPEKIVLVGPSDDSPACGAGLPPNAVVTVTFADLDGRTKLTIHTQLRSADDVAAVTQAGYVVGWESCLDRLAEIV